MLRLNVIIAVFIAVIVCICLPGSLMAAEDYDKAALIKDLNIKDAGRNPYLSLDEWLKEAPAVPGGISKERRDAFYRAWVTLWINTQPAQGAWGKPIICPGDNYVRGIWIWDSAYHVFGLAHGGPKARLLGLWQIEVMLSGQHESGKLPREIWTDGPKFYGQYGIQAPGLLTLAANRLMQAADSKKERADVKKAMADFYPKLVKNHEWFVTTTKTGDGLCTWKTVDAGWDTSTRWDKDVWAALDLDCFLYLDCIELAKMARTLGKKDEVKSWDAKAREMREAIRKLHWNEKLGVYNDILPDKSVSDSITPVIFWPMWLGIATSKQADSAVKYLNDPKVFATKWTMPSVAAGDAGFTPRDYWRGPVWINLNWTAVRGLERCGQKAAAAALREKTLDLIARTPVIYEYYDSLTGDGLGSCNYGWSSALYIDLILEP